MAFVSSFGVEQHSQNQSLQISGINFNPLCPVTEFKILPSSDPSSTLGFSAIKYPGKSCSPGLLCPSIDIVDTSKIGHLVVVVNFTIRNNNTVPKPLPVITISVMCPPKSQFSVSFNRKAMKTSYLFQQYLQTSDVLIKVNGFATNFPDCVQFTDIMLLTAKGAVPQSAIGSVEKHCISQPCSMIRIRKEAFVQIQEIKFLIKAITNVTNIVGYST